MENNQQNIIIYNTQDGRGVTCSRPPIPIKKSIKQDLVDNKQVNN